VAWLLTMKPAFHAEWLALPAKEQGQGLSFTMMRWLDLLGAP